MVRGARNPPTETIIPLRYSGVPVRIHPIKGQRHQGKASTSPQRLTISGVNPPNGYSLFTPTFNIPTFAYANWIFKVLKM